MIVEKYYPQNILSRYIKMFMIIETEYELNSLILPDTSLVIAFTLKGRVKYSENSLKNDIPSTVISGISRSAIKFLYSKQTLNILIFLKEAKASSFIKEPLIMLFNQRVDLNDLFCSSSIVYVEERLLEARTNRERVLILEQFLLSNLIQPKPDDIVEYAITMINRYKGNIIIKNLLESVPISRDPFEKRFRRVTGTTPKQFATIVRLKNVVAQYSSVRDLTSLAYTAGYFDQSHFIKDFKSFTGLTPSEYFIRS